MNTKINRRTFLQKSGKAGIALGISIGTLRASAEGSPNEKVIAAVAGINDRGIILQNNLQNCQIVK